MIKCTVGLAPRTEHQHSPVDVATPAATTVVLAAAVAAAAVACCEYLGRREIGL